MINITKITCEYNTNPINVSCQNPCFGYVIESDKQNTIQQSYQIQVFSDKNLSKLHFDTGVIFSTNSTNIKYSGMPLQSMTAYYYRIAVSTNHEASEFSQAQFFETTILKSELVEADFITATKKTNIEFDGTAVFKKTFMQHKDVEKARLYITSLGINVPYINGEKATGDLLAPGFTNYNSLILYNTYDVTSFIQGGENDISIRVARGWYGGLSDWSGGASYKTRPIKVLALLRIWNTDGSSYNISTDESWLCSGTPVSFSSIYDGEHHNNYGFAEDFKPCKACNEQDKALLSPNIGTAVKIQHKIDAVSIFKSPKGETIVDFGQNIAGIISVKCAAKAKDEFSIRFAEVLDNDNNFYTENLRSAKQTFSATLDGTETYITPQFTYFGFRYICVDRFFKNPEIQDFTAYAIFSQMEKTSDFSCNNSDITSLINNTLWGMRSNFIDIPTDCPQRDERLGWTGDAQIFSKTACYFYNTANFFKKWLLDIATEQLPNGGIPNTIPDMFRPDNIDTYTHHSSAGWAQAIFIIPYNIYLFYGDTRVLTDNLNMMKRFYDFSKSMLNSEYIYVGGEHFGDWLGIDADSGSLEGITSKTLIATAFFACSAQYMEKISIALGIEYEEYKSDFIKVRDAFIASFLECEQNASFTTQTAYSLALEFQLYKDDTQKQAIAAALALLVTKAGVRLQTGFIGTPYISSALFDSGYQELAVELLLQKEYPSWLYPLSKGATTIWEHWDGIKPDGSMWESSMNSFNHYAYGSVSEFIFAKIFGIQLLKGGNGTGEFIFAPFLHKAFTSFSFKYNSLFGIAQITRENSIIDITLPSNCTATVQINTKTYKIGSGKHSFTVE